MRAKPARVSGLGRYDLDGGHYSRQNSYLKFIHLYKPACIGVLGELCSNAATLDDSMMTKMTETTTPPDFVIICGGVVSAQHEGWLTCGLLPATGGVRRSDLSFKLGELAVQSLQKALFICVRQERVANAVI